jgi:rare lipoprotein A
MASTERKGTLTRSIGVGILCLMLLQIHTLPLLAAEQVAAKVVEKQAVAKVAEKPAVVAEKQGAEKPAVAGEPQKTSMVKKLIGIASYYAKRFTGRRTTSGQRYQPEKLTAAHPNLPLGTKVRVKNLDNDKEVTVVINDRCRKKSFPFIDLSRAAAKKLGFFGAGKAKVAIVPLTDEES